MSDSPPREPSSEPARPPPPSTIRYEKTQAPKMSTAGCLVVALLVGGLLLLIGNRICSAL